MSSPLRRTQTLPRSLPSPRRSVNMPRAFRGGAVAQGDREILGHPRGLVVLAGTELWERISFHGMQALLVLYMVGQLLLPGHVEHIAGFARFRAIVESVTGPLSPQALASQIFGLYVGLIYLTPIFGGLLGDRVLGRRLSDLLHHAQYGRFRSANHHRCARPGIWLALRKRPY